MQKDAGIKDKRSSEQPTDLLWAWSFSVVDWLGMTIASVMFVAIVTILLSSPAVVERSGMMSTMPMFSVLATSAVVIIKPQSNTTRIPAVYIMMLSAIAIAINWSLL